jgi:hypothetical protein
MRIKNMGAKKNKVYQSIWDRRQALSYNTVFSAGNEHCLHFQVVFQGTTTTTYLSLKRVEKNVNYLDGIFPTVTITGSH